MYHFACQQNKQQEMQYFFPALLSSPSRPERPLVHCSLRSQVSFSPILYLFSEIDIILEVQATGRVFKWMCVLVSQPVCSKVMAAQGCNILISPSPCKVTAHLEDVSNLVQENPLWKILHPHLSYHQGLVWPQSSFLIGHIFRHGVTQAGGSYVAADGNQDLQLPVPNLRASLGCCSSSGGHPQHARPWIPAHLQWWWQLSMQPR